MVSMVLALVVSLTFEAPFLALEKVLFGIGGGDRRDEATPKKAGSASDPPSYESEMRHQRTFTKTNSNGHSNGSHSNGGHSNGGYRNSGDGLYRPTRENGVGQSQRGAVENGFGQQRGGHENGAFCRL